MSTRRAFEPGFRISEVDAGFILAALAASAFLARFLEQLAIAALFVLLHFFLFCNVLRMQRTLELLWAAAFIGLWTCSYLWEIPSWLHTYALAMVATVTVTLVQLRLPSYHGVFWGALNPSLPQWWDSQAPHGPKGEWTQ